MKCGQKTSLQSPLTLFSSTHLTGKSFIRQEQSVLFEPTGMGTTVSNSNLFSLKIVVENKSLWLQSLKKKPGCKIATLIGCGSNIGHNELENHAYAGREKNPILPEIKADIITHKEGKSYVTSGYFWLKWFSFYE